MNANRYKSMGLNACMLAAITLFHPIVAFVDILPDLIGYALLYIGLTKFADLNEHIAEARGNFRKMLFVGAGQLIATYVVYGMIDTMMREHASEMSAYEAPMLKMLFSFVLLVMQWFFLIPAWKELFMGLNSMAERFDATSLTREHRKKTACERMAKRSTTFVVATSLLSFLPEASVLTSYEARNENPLFPFDWYQFINLFRVAAGTVSLIIGIVWLISYLRLLTAFKRDPAFLNGATQAYQTTVLPKTGMFAVRRFSAAFLLMTLGSIFTVSIRINYYAVAPGLLFSAFVIAGIAVLGKSISKKRGCIVAAILLAIVSTAELVANHMFLKNHLPEASLYETDAYWQFLGVRLLDAAEAIATFILVGALLEALYEMVLSYTIVDYKTKGSELLSLRATERQHKEYKKRICVLLVIFALSTVASVADAIWRLEFAWIWIISASICAIGIWNLYSLMQDIGEQIRFYYQPDALHKND